MDTKSFLDNWIVKNLLRAVVLVVGLAIVVNIVLSIITQHGRELTVPDMTGLLFEECQEIAAATGITVEIADSVYVRRMKPGAVFSQLPKAGSKVKKGRRVLLTTNAVKAKTVSMPSLVGLSMRQAKSELNAKGLVLGKLIYVEDMATNNVLKQMYKGVSVDAGTQVESGSSINLVVGLNGEDGITFVPNVLGLKYQRAVDAIQENSLNVGRLYFDKTVETYADTLNALVYSQTPDASLSYTLTLGSQVGISLTMDASKVPAMPAYFDKAEQ